MINKVIASYILFACFVAIALKLAGVEGTIHFGSYFRAYIVQTNRELIDFKIAIPDIPEIPVIPRQLTPGDNWFIVLNVLVELVNRLSSFINFITRFLNIIIALLNVVIQTLELIFIFIKNLIVMRDSIAATTIV